LLKGLNHITLSVSDLSRSVAYYTELLGFSLRARWNRGAYLALGDLWLCLGHDAHVRNSPLAEYSHFALSVDRADFVHAGSLESRLAALRKEPYDGLLLYGRDT